MPETKLATADYLPIFAGWRNEHYDPATSAWSALGKDFLQVVNKAIKDAGNTPYPNSKEGFDDLRAKHNTTRLKYKNTKIKPIDAAFNVTSYMSQGVGKRKTPNLNHLDADQRKAYMAERVEVENLISTKMPGLPSYVVASRGGLTGEQMDDLLG